jgi:hypothetical protein
VDNDVRKAGVRNWRMEAKHIDGWWRILEKVKAHLLGYGATDDDDDEMFITDFTAARQRTKMIHITPSHSTEGTL